MLTSYVWQCHLKHRQYELIVQKKSKLIIRLFYVKTLIMQSHFFATYYHVVERLLYQWERRSGSYSVSLFLQRKEQV